MKKLITIGALCCAMFGFAGSNDTYTTVYDFAAKISVPYLSGGVRTHKTHAFTGYMYMTFDETGAKTTKIEMLNKNTGVMHVIESSDAFYNLMGKSSKAAVRTTPTIWVAGADADEATIDDTIAVAQPSFKKTLLNAAVGGHELITTVGFAGTGALKTTKKTVTGCGVCGEPTKTTVYCNILASMTGSMVGVMDCLCPDDEKWNHTVMADPCGPMEGDAEDVRSHDASFKGTWKAKYNEKRTNAANL